MIPEQTRHPVDALHAELRRALDEQLERLTAEYDAALEDAHRAAAREAEEVTAARLEALKADWTARLDSEVSTARSEAERQALAAAEQVRGEVEQQAAASATRIREELEERFATERQRLEEEHQVHRGEADQRAQRLNDELQAAQAHASTTAATLTREAEAARALADTQLAKLGRELEEARRQLDNAERQLEDAKGELEVTSGELDVARGQLEEVKSAATAVEETQVIERESQLAGFDRLAAALRALDETGSLSQTLETLLHHAAAVAGRAIVFLITGERLKSWKTSGFPELDAHPFEAAITGTSLLAQALQSGEVVGSGPGHPAPTFANVPADRAALAVPLFVGDRVVALLYSDNVGASSEVPSAWPEIVETIARHAARVLGLLTAARRIEALTGTASGIVRGPQATDEPGARRYARLLLSEIKLYNEAAVREAREQRNLRSRFSTEIDRARRLYEERVPASLAERHVYFDQELVHTLADGDPALLG